MTGQEVPVNMPATIGDPVTMGPHEQRSASKLAAPLNLQKETDGKVSSATRASPFQPRLNSHSLKVFHVSNVPIADSVIQDRRVGKHPLHVADSTYIPKVEGWGGKEIVSVLVFERAKKRAPSSCGLHVAKLLAPIFANIPSIDRALPTFQLPRPSAMKAVVWANILSK